MDELETKVDAWWKRTGRDEFLGRVKAALSDSKVKNILSTEKDKAKIEERLKGRVPADVLPFLLA